MLEHRGPPRYEGGMRRIVFSLVPVLALFVACSDSATPADDGGVDAATSNDASTAVDTAVPATDGAPADAASDAGLTLANEVEPNDGKTTTEVGTMVLPGTMNGKIDPADDTDVFTLTLAPGEFWEWTLAPTSADLAPHLAVFDTSPSSKNPTALVAGKVSTPLSLEHFVLNTGTFVAAVRDARNVPTKTGRGGPGYGYALTGRRKTLNPIAVTFPSSKSGRLASLGAVDVYAFTTTNGKGFDVTLRAKRKTAPSTLDSRMSLFEVSGKRTLITNDNEATSTDSQFGGDTALTGTHYVIVDNEGTDATDLSYDLEFSLRP